MSILKKFGQALESLDEKVMNECLHDDYAFTNYSQGKIFSKSEVIKWAMSGDINRENVRILFENDKVGVEHAFVSFNDGNKQAVLAFFTFKDGKIYTLEKGDIFYVSPQPHDSWVVGDQEYISLHFLGAEKYAD